MGRLGDIHRTPSEPKIRFLEQGLYPDWSRGYLITRKCEYLLLILFGHSKLIRIFSIGGTIDFPTVELCRYNSRYLCTYLSFLSGLITPAYCIVTTLSFLNSSIFPPLKVVNKLKLSHVSKICTSKIGIKRPSLRVTEFKRCIYYSVFFIMGANQSRSDPIDEKVFQGETPISVSIFFSIASL